MMNTKLPTIICTSVIRSSQQGESHGGMYLVDLNTEKFHQVVDWNDQAIDWQGRGADRGLRGVAFYNNFTFAAASDEVFVYDQNFNITKTFRNHYLKHCHEIFIHDNILHLSSTGYDSVLLFDLRAEKFIKGYCYRKVSNIGMLNLGTIPKLIEKLTGEKTEYLTFDPNQEKGPEPADTHHINNVFYDKQSIYFSGTKMQSLMAINIEGELSEWATIPKGTHNVQFYRDYLLMNHTGNDSVLMNDKSGKRLKEFDILMYKSEDLLHTNLPNDHARQGFGRGLCTYEDYIIAGSSPATISVYHIESGVRIKSITLTKDIRNAIHGLEVYPYQTPSDFSL